jgi:hypothetical protein
MCQVFVTDAMTAIRMTGMHFEHCQIKKCVFNLLAAIPHKILANRRFVACISAANNSIFMQVIMSTNLHLKK